MQNKKDEDPYTGRSLQHQLCPSAECFSMIPVDCVISIWTLVHLIHYVLILSSSDSSISTRYPSTLDFSFADGVRIRTPSDSAIRHAILRARSQRRDRPSPDGSSRMVASHYP